MIEVVAPDGAGIEEFASLQRRVYRRQGVGMAISPADMRAFFRRDSPWAEGRRLHPLIAREGRRVVARAVAVCDERYNRHWNEKLGHILMFEALSNAREASARLLEQACAWLKEQGLAAARAGFGPFEPGFLIDEYETFLPRVARHNPAYYHALLKGAGFETEKGSGEYIIRVGADLVTRYERGLREVRALGYEIVPLTDVSPGERVPDFTRAWNESYASHWGLAPVTEPEFATLFESARDPAASRLSAIAYRNGRAVGVALVRRFAHRQGFVQRWAKGPSRRELEGLQSFAVGVCPSERGRGVSVALAAHTYLQLIAQGARYLSYGLVIDDNWASRRLAAKLGAYACANYLTYRVAIEDAHRAGKFA